MIDSVKKGYGFKEQIDKLELLNNEQQVLSQVTGENIVYDKASSKGNYAIPRSRSTVHLQSFYQTETSVRLWNSIPSSILAIQNYLC